MSRTSYDARKVKSEVERCVSKCRVTKGNMLEESKNNLKQAIHTLESFNDTYVLLTLSKEDKELLYELKLLPEGVY